MTEGQPAAQGAVAAVAPALRGAPIGVFDSGIGGLSVLQALRAELPGESFVYLADTAHAPYGPRSADDIRRRSLAITGALRRSCGVKALVVACNTATAAAIEALRLAHPDLPLVGVEPALKPAAERSQTRQVGVLVTEATARSPRFATLLARQRADVGFDVVPCEGLAAAIDAQDTTKIEALCDRFTLGFRQKNGKKARVDTVVLGCTHYPLVSDVLSRLLGPGVELIDTGVPVARHTRMQLQARGLLRPLTGEDAKARGAHPTSGTLRLLSTGGPAPLAAAARRWLSIDQPVGLLSLD
ncbi:glutamate racemase [Tibeticola sp.]|uniref:glutamate racemase n=1 Tax=Tibeticola sp. TaxID=2005368 RepID=UPI0025FD7487|nr:glutamate racemase [Tibeticola sp.]